MENKINIAELLKDCPKGMELYSPLCGKCFFDRLNMGTIICKKQNTQEITFTSGGYYMLPVFDNCECMIFPSKDQRDWGKFQKHFKDGDIIFTHANCLKVGLGNTWISIYQENRNGGVATYVDYAEDGSDYYSNIDGDKAFLCMEKDILRQRLATEEEKEKLFDAIKANGYKWNAETKTLEKLVEPKFKVGDRVMEKDGISVPILITGVGDTYYWSTTENSTGVLPIAEQDDWELVPDKFDITTLKPFDKVLVRTFHEEWKADFFSHYSKEADFPYSTVGKRGYYYCIPYEKNEHLLGTTDDCNEYYKTWE